MTVPSPPCSAAPRTPRLDGHPIPAGARELAADGRWRRMLSTTPASSATSASTPTCPVLSCSARPGRDRACGPLHPTGERCDHAASTPSGLLSGIACLCGTPPAQPRPAGATASRPRRTIWTAPPAGLYLSRTSEPGSVSDRRPAPGSGANRDSASLAELPLGAAAGRTRVTPHAPSPTVAFRAPSSRLVTPGRNAAVDSVRSAFAALAFAG